MRAEAIVVGAGVIGALTAYELRKRGLEVLLLDAGFPGRATDASAGMLAPHPEGLRGELLEAALWSIEAYPALLEELKPFGPVEAGFSGVYVAALSPGEVELWEAHEPLPYPVRGGQGGRRFPGGYVNPRALREALLRALAAQGVPLLEARVEEIGEGWARWAGGEAWGRWVVLALGAWGGRFGLPVRPLKGEALLLEGPPPPGPLFAGGGYILPRGEGVYLGATEREGWGEGVDLFGLRWLSDYAHERFPLLEGARFLGVLWGYRPAGEPFVRALGQGVVAAGGHGRNGVLLAPWTARQVLRLMGVEG